MKQHARALAALFALTLLLAGCAGLAEAIESASWPAIPTGEPGANNPITGVTNVLLPWVPAPARLPIIFTLALAGTLMRAARTRRGLASVVKGLDVAMRKDAEFARAFSAHADTFRALQTAASKEVDKIAGRAVTMRLGAS